MILWYSGGMIGKLLQKNYFLKNAKKTCKPNNCDLNRDWRIKNGTEVTLKLLSNVVGDSSVENNFVPKLLLTNTQFLRLCKAFANNSSANVKLSKTQLHKIGQSGEF